MVTNTTRSGSESSKGNFLEKKLTENDDSVERVCGGSGEWKSDEKKEEKISTLRKFLFDASTHRRQRSHTTTAAERVREREKMSQEKVVEKKKKCAIYSVVGRDERGKSETFFLSFRVRHKVGKFINFTDVHESEGEGISKKFDFIW